MKMKFCAIIFLLTFLFITVLGKNIPWKEYRQEMFDMVDAKFDSPMTGRGSGSRKIIDRHIHRMGSEMLKASQLLLTEINFGLASAIWYEFQIKYPDLARLNKLQRMVAWLDQQKKLYRTSSFQYKGINPPNNNKWFSNSSYTRIENLVDGKMLETLKFSALMIFSLKNDKDLEEFRVRHGYHVVTDPELKDIKDELCQHLFRNKSLNQYMADKEFKSLNLTVKMFNDSMPAKLVDVAYLKNMMKGYKVPNSEQNETKTLEEHRRKERLNKLFEIFKDIIPRSKRSVTNQTELAVLDHETCANVSNPEKVTVGIKKSIFYKVCSHYKPHFGYKSCEEIYTMLFNEVYNNEEKNGTIPVVQALDLAEEMFAKLIFEQNLNITRQFNELEDPLQIFFLNNPISNNTSCNTMPIFFMLLSHHNNVAIPFFVTKIKAMSFVLDSIVSQVANETDYYMQDFIIEELSSISNTTFSLQNRTKEKYHSMEFSSNVNNTNQNGTLKSKFVISFVQNPKISLKNFETLSQWVMETRDIEIEQRKDDRLNVEYKEMVIDKLLKYKNEFYKSDIRTVAQQSFHKIFYLNDLINVCYTKNFFFQRVFGVVKFLTRDLLKSVIDEYKSIAANVSIDLLKPNYTETTIELTHKFDRLGFEYTMTQIELERSMCDSLLKNTSVNKTTKQMEKWVKIMQNTKVENLKKLTLHFYGDILYLLKKTATVEDFFLANEIVNHQALIYVKTFLNLTHYDRVKMFSGSRTIEHGLLIGLNSDFGLAGFPFELFEVEEDDSAIGDSLRPTRRKTEVI